MDSRVRRQDWFKNALGRLAPNNEEDDAKLETDGTESDGEQVGESSSDESHDSTDDTESDYDDFIDADNVIHWLPDAPVARLESKRLLSTNLPQDGDAPSTQPASKRLRSTAAPLFGVASTGSATTEPLVITRLETFQEMIARDDKLYLEALNRKAAMNPWKSLFLAPQKEMRAEAIKQGRQSAVMACLLYEGWCEFERLPDMSMVNFRRIVDTSNNAAEVRIVANFIVGILCGHPCPRPNMDVTITTSVALYLWTNLVSQTEDDLVLSINLMKLASDGGCNAAWHHIRSIVYHTGQRPAGATKRKLMLVLIRHGLSNDLDTTEVRHFANDLLDAVNATDDDLPDVDVQVNRDVAFHLWTHPRSTEADSVLAITLLRMTAYGRRRLATENATGLITRADALPEGDFKRRLLKTLSRHVERAVPLPECPSP